MGQVKGRILDCYEVIFLNELNDLLMKEFKFKVLILSFEVEIFNDENVDEIIEKGHVTIYSNLSKVESILIPLTSKEMNSIFFTIRDNYEDFGILDDVRRTSITQGYKILYP